MSNKKTNNLKNSTLLQLYTRAAAPSRDYYGLTIAESCICLNIWKITYGPHVFPKQKLCEISDFRDDKYMQEEIKNTFGQNVFNYIKNVCDKKRKLENLPQKLFLNIVKYLCVNDVLQLARLNKIFYELCNREEIWQLMFRKTLRRLPSAEERRMAFDCGWKEALKRRMTFIKKALVANSMKGSTSSIPSVPAKSNKSPPNKKAIALKKSLVKAK